jgi:hypothetical protein
VIGDIRDQHLIVGQGFGLHLGIVLEHCHPIAAREEEVIGGDGVFFLIIKRNVFALLEDEDVLDASRPIHLDEFAFGGRFDGIGHAGIDFKLQPRDAGEAAKLADGPFVVVALLLREAGGEFQIIPDLAAFGFDGLEEVAKGMDVADRPIGDVTFREIGS